MQRLSQLLAYYFFLIPGLRIVKFSVDWSNLIFTSLIKFVSMKSIVDVNMCLYEIVNTNESTESTRLYHEIAAVEIGIVGKQHAKWIECKRENRKKWMKWMSEKKIYTQTERNNNGMEKVNKRMENGIPIMYVYCFTFTGTVRSS